MVSLEINWKYIGVFYSSLRYHILFDKKKADFRYTRRFSFVCRIEKKKTASFDTSIHLRVGRFGTGTHIIVFDFQNQFFRFHQVVTTQFT
jgi:hypothetical protein